MCLRIQAHISGCGFSFSFSSFLLNACVNVLICILCTSSYYHFLFSVFLYELNVSQIYSKIVCGYMFCVCECVNEVRFCLRMCVCVCACVCERAKLV